MNWRRDGLVVWKPVRASCSVLRSSSSGSRKFGLSEYQIAVGLAEGHDPWLVVGLVML